MRISTVSSSPHDRSSLPISVALMLVPMIWELGRTFYRELEDANAASVDVVIEDTVAWMNQESEASIFEGNMSRQLRKTTLDV